jgi:aminopeptidase N
MDYFLPQTNNMNLVRYDVMIDLNHSIHSNTYGGRVDMHFKIDNSNNDTIQFHASPHTLNIHAVKLEQNNKNVSTSFKYLHSSQQLHQQQQSQQQQQQEKKKSNRKQQTNNKQQQQQQQKPNESLEESIITVDALKLVVGKCKLTVSFNSRKPIPTSSEQLTGLFYSKNFDILQTHFEPAFAHFVFPCIDTFEAKAIFKLTLSNVPKTSSNNLEYNTISNMPIERTLDGKTSQTIVFEQTPIMSPYLFVWIISPFKSLVDNYNDNLPIRILYQHQPSSLVTTAQLVMETTLKTIPILEDYFDAKFSDQVPKIDFVLVPEHCFGGMEHWGCITLHVTGSTDKKKQKKQEDEFIELIIHELAHFFVGNLVSFPIVIKEGLAQYFEKAIGDQILGRSTPSINMTKESTSGNTIDNNRKMNQQTASLKDQFSNMFNGLSYDASLNFICDLIRSAGGQDVFQKRMQTLIREYDYKYLSHEEYVQFILSQE